MFVIFALINPTSAPTQGHQEKQDSQVLILKPSVTDLCGDLIKSLEFISTVSLLVKHNRLVLTI